MTQIGNERATHRSKEYQNRIGLLLPLGEGRALLRSGSVVGALNFCVKRDGRWVFQSLKVNAWMDRNTVL